MGCEGCIHLPYCGYFNLYDGKMTEEERFKEHCVGCCCGDGAECNKHNGDGHKCTNWEDGSEPLIG